MTSRFTFPFIGLLLLLCLGQGVFSQTLNVTINKKAGQSNTTSPVIFTAVFSAAINVASFTKANVVLSGTATTKTVSAIKQVTPNDGTTFEITATADNNGTLMAAIPAAVYTSTIFGNTDFNPSSIILDNVGNVYTTNYGANTISQITTGGASNTQYGITGKESYGITIDANGNVYTANVKDKTITKITKSGLASTYGVTGNGPFGITIDGAGNIYTANEFSSNVSKITPAGVSTILGTTGKQPDAIKIDASGNIYTANFGDNTVTKITSSGTVTLLGTTGASPTSITIDASGNIYTANNSDNNITKITPAGVSTNYGSTGANPQGIAIDGLGNIYTANMDDYTISKITASGVSTIIGATGVAPLAIAIDGSGNLYTANSGDYNVTKLTPPTGIALSGSTTPSNSASTTSDNGYVLPVSLLYFTAISNKCAATLNWQTSSEINSSYYNIETSIDASIFSEGYRLASKNIATGATYSYTFNAMASGVNYYRLKIVDKDGNYAYSKTVAITANGNCGTRDVPMASPNPAKDFIIVEGIAKGNHLSLLNAAGVLMHTMEATGTTQRINISQYANGIYMLRIEAADGSVHDIKVVKI